MAKPAAGITSMTDANWEHQTAPNCDDVCWMAQALARNCQYAVFPVLEDKRPALKDWPKLASKDAAGITDLWRRHTCPLVGVVTGAASGISVLDIDRKHDAACLFWQRNRERLLPTRAYETRSGGVHLYYRHQDGIRNTQGRVCSGVDTRGEGGYIICWWCAGFACYDHSPVAHWPEWLELTKPKLYQAAISTARGRQTYRPLIAIIERVARAVEGERNGVLYWAARRCVEGGMLDKTAETTLVAAATAAGLPEIEARRTIASAHRAS